MMSREERMYKRVEKKVNRVLNSIEEYLHEKRVFGEKEKLTYYETFLRYMDRVDDTPEDTEEYRFLSLVINNNLCTFSNGLTFEDIEFYNGVANELSNKVYTYDEKTKTIKRRSLML